MSAVESGAPGIYRELLRETPDAEFRTGTPAFLGLVHPDATIADEAPALTRAAHLAQRVDRPLAGGYLEAAVRGFFDNGGQRCHVVAVRAPTASLVELTSEAVHERMIAALRGVDEMSAIDLVAFPDLMLPLKAGGSDVAARMARWSALIASQVELVQSCRAARWRLAILDAPPVVPGIRESADDELREYALRLGDALQGRDPALRQDAALYGPWLRPERGPLSGAFIPPSGHVAGVYARMDAQVGVHRPPAGVDLIGVCDLSLEIGDAEQGPLVGAGVNCLRAFRGRGIRVWGARTLSPTDEGRHVNVRRLIQTLARWLEFRLADLTMEPNDSMLWNRVSRAITDHLVGLFEAGALRGRIASDAFYVKCDAETNPPELRDAGVMVCEIGLAPLAPQEFITIRLVQRSEGLSLTEAAPG